MTAKELPCMPKGPVLKLDGVVKRFHIPKGLKCLIEEAARDVLRTQPENLYSFLADFMDGKMLRREFEGLLEPGKDAALHGPRKSWEWRRWSWEGSSLLTQDELIEFLNEFNISMEAAERLATIIQSAYRGFVARQEVKAKKEGRRRRRESLWDEWRQEGKLLLSRRDVQEILDYYGISLEVANTFATKIQALFRGHYIRQNLKKGEPVVGKHRHSLGAALHEGSHAADTSEEIAPTVVATSDQAIGDQSKEYQRLPKNTAPSNYSLTLKPNLSDFTFEGSQKIKIDITVESPEIKMNSAELELHEVTWESESTGESIKPTSVKLDAEKETLALSFDPPIPPGRGTLEMNFTGILNNQMKGFYRSQYKTIDGEERYCAVTQFESTDARRCFPCWDEPVFKATFDVTLVAPKDRVALSNMPIRSTTNDPTDDNLLNHVFDTTPIMSTYLLAFVIGEFDYLEATTVDGVICRVYTPIDKKEQGKFALDCAVRVLPFYNSYFGVAYPLPKLDMVAIPDFTAGAMENWGLITYRETFLLAQEQESSALKREQVALTIAHEIAHQWFGNLVTMEWWTDLWLKEGYATFVGFMGVDHLFPEYDIWTQFLTDIHTSALKMDGLKNSHPIEVPVQNPSEIEEIFDTISYSKGASIIRMLHHFLGEENFRKGMNLYLTRYQYKNASTADLWNVLSEASSKPAGDVMTTWTKQMGYPLIKVEALNQVGIDIVLSLTQEKFWTDPSMTKEISGGESCWIVPLTFTTSNDPTKSVYDTLMDKKNLSVTIPGAGSAQWVKVNSAAVGFYRVKYSPEVMTKFVPAIQSKTMQPLDRLGLLDDLFALYQSGEATVVDLLGLLSAYIEEDNYTVFTRINSIFAKLNGLMLNSALYKEFKAFGRSIFTKIAEHIGWEAKEGESHLQTRLRTLVMNRMIIFDDLKTRNEALRQFQLHISGQQILPADLKSVVYGVAASKGSDELFESMMKKYREQDDQDERDLIAETLSYFKDPEKLKQVLDFAISDDVRSQDSIYLIINVGGNGGGNGGMEMAWEFFKQNWKLFADRDPNGIQIGRILKRVLANFTTEEEALEIESFFRDHPFPGTERSVQQTIESIRLNDTWIKRDLGSIETYLGSLNLNLED